MMQEELKKRIKMEEEEVERLKEILEDLKK